MLNSREYGYLYVERSGMQLIVVPPRGCNYFGNVLCLKLGGGCIGVCYIFMPFCVLDIRISQLILKSLKILPERQLRLFDYSFFVPLYEQKIYPHYMNGRFIAVCLGIKKWVTFKIKFCETFLRVKDSGVVGSL